jgi:hypothetical protein
LLGAIPGSVGPVRYALGAPAPPLHDQRLGDREHRLEDARVDDLAAPGAAARLQRGTAPSAPNMPVSESPMLMPIRIGGRSG